MVIAVVSVVVVGTIIAIALSSRSTSPVPEAEQESGALVSLKMNSQVGVVLDEIPESVRDHSAAGLATKDTDFWIERAKDQIRLMAYRLIFRDSYYEESDGKGALPLPPERVWDVQIGATPQRTSIGSHDLVLVNYTFASTLLTGLDSPGKSEPNLESIGGTWEEPFVLPIDPVLVFQRTGFACMDENQFPPRSVDAEEVDTFYDQETDVEDELSIQGFHQTVMPEMSCIDALDEKIGKVETSLIFERLPWDSALADNVRVGEITNPTGPDLIVEESDFKTNRLVYRYIGSDSCAVTEASVDGTGWHRLLQFGAADRNFGAKTLEIGNIDYYIEGNGTELSRQGIYEFSPCHNHYHFKHYGFFNFGDEPANHKMGFCLQSTNRYSNNEQSPLSNVYSACTFQGIEVGWVDQYKAGLEGQWVDVTGVDTSQAPVTKQLTFHSNPDGFLCEGVPVMDSEGKPAYEPTEFKTDNGQTVYRQKCEFGTGTLENNVHSYNITLPTDGNGYVTENCKKGEMGPLRNCGFEMVENTPVFNCTPGQEVRLTSSIPEGAAPQVVRVCEYSSVLATPIPCTYNGPFNAQSLANGVIETSSQLTFDCPQPLDDNERGGRFSLYVAPVMPDDPSAPVIFKIP